MRYIFFIQLLICSSGINAQLIFQPISFDNALKKAKEGKKYILLQFESSNCKQCNEVADKGMDNNEVAFRIKKTFIPIKIDTDHPDRKLISTNYNIKNFGLFFLDHNGVLIHAFNQSSTSHKEYIKQFEIFLNKAGESLRLNELEKLYAPGNNSTDILEAILFKRKSLSLSTDSLLEVYVKMIPSDSFNRERTLNFIAQMSPILGSKADFELHKNNELFSKMWYDIPLNTRISINSGIIHKSMEKAVNEKNESYALRVASFTRGTYSNNTVAGMKAFEFQMLSFYKGTGNTTEYFKKSISYYDKYYMSISIDSLNEIQEKNFYRSLETNPQKEIVKEGNVTRVTVQTIAKPISQSYSQDLNSAALYIYRNTNDPILLNRALEWIKRANAFFETAEVLDTYSRLLYQLNRTAEAIEAQDKSIALRKTRGFPFQEYESVLIKMKKGEKID